MSEERKAAFKERQKQIELAAARGEEHLGSEVSDIIQQRKARKLGLRQKQQSQTNNQI